MESTTQSEGEKKVCILHNQQSTDGYLQMSDKVLYNMDRHSVPEIALSIFVRH